MHVFEISSCDMIFLLSFMKTGAGIQADLRFCLMNFNDCNVGMTNGKEL
jgi:hypothetical protein